MRWLVEVSHVGDMAASERYCIEAKRWQAALQEARRLRGDAGALPKLTIELLDQGYRAVDPALKIRYVVTEAPAGTQLTEGAQALLTTYPPPAVSESQAPSSKPVNLKPPSVRPPSLSAPPPAVRPSPTPAVPSASSYPPATLASPRPLYGPFTAQVIRQREEHASASSPIEYRELALAVRPGSSREDVKGLLEARLEEIRTDLTNATQRYVQIAVFDHSFVKRPVRPPIATLIWKDWRGDPVVTFPGFGDEVRPTSDPPPALSSRAPSWMPSGAAGLSSAPLGPLPDNLRGASVAPRPASVVPARVVAVGPSAAPPARVVSVGPSAASAPSENARPAAAEPAVLTPAPLRDRGPMQTLQSAPPPTAESFELTGDEEEIPISISVTDSEPAGAAAAVPAALEAAAVPARAEDPGRTLASNVAASVPVAAASVAPAPAPVAAASVAPAPAPAPASSSVAPAPAPPAPVESAAPHRSDPPRTRRSDPAHARKSDPALARRRAPGEDLIGDLFESIHDLSFMVDLVSGADFVISVLGDVIPCEAIVVHAFDLGRREFVVVRARGPNPRGALMHRTPDADPNVREVMRRRSLTSNGASPTRSGALEKLGTEPRLVLSAAVRQGGRYLGLIELANPAGGTPFHEGEASALEYVCEQFAEFVASRPIVLDEDVVLGH
jgi:hypothetical protein